MQIFRCFLFLLLTIPACGFCQKAQVELGVDRLFREFPDEVRGKNIGLITNHTALAGDHVSTIELFREKEKDLGFTLKALFAPEHGLFGQGYAGEKVPALGQYKGISVFGLYGATRRPTKKMLEGLDLLVFDVQDLGCRSYTFQATLYYAMEEAAKANIRLLVLDRPNPINGEVVDGPMLEKAYRSFLGYINVPYCHGMTIGELARFFNKEYKIGCDLVVIPMKGWKRSMSFSDTGLLWVPTSPNIPDADTVFFYPMTGFLGEFSVVSIGVGYTLPFKVVAAPWIQAEPFAEALNQANLPGVNFVPIHFRPFASSLKGKTCHGVLITVSDHRHFLPVTTGYLLMATLKELYPVECKAFANENESHKNLFMKCCGTKAVFDLLLKENPPLKDFQAIHAAEREKFLKLRKIYLNPEYQ
jgi:uncharacterized protein YbbC (DUF1343 family)